MKRVNRHIEATNPEKIFFPASGIRKQDVVGYYKKISEAMTPHIAGRPLTVRRFPNGIRSAGFMQKEKQGYYPQWIQSVRVKKEGGTIEMPLANDAASLAYLANQGAIEFHVWLSRKENLYCPDKMIIDLDPPGKDFTAVEKGAQLIRELYAELKLNAYVMTTGSKGLHIVAPLSGAEDYEIVKAFAKEIAAYLSGRYPERFTAEVRKEKRKGRIFVDYLRNAYAQTGIAPYSVRPFESAPVATPLSWDEVEDDRLQAQTFTIKNIFDRLEKNGDPWREFFKNSQRVADKMDKISELVGRATPSQ